MMTREDFKRAKKADAFAQFDQVRHALAMREVDMSRNLLAVYRYALDRATSWPRNDRDLCKRVKQYAESDLRALEDECPTCGDSCCEHGDDKSNLRDVIDACDKVLEEMEVRP